MWCILSECSIRLYGVLKISVQKWINTFKLIFFPLQIEEEKKLFGELLFHFNHNMSDITTIVILESRDCKELQGLGLGTSGVYTIYPGNIPKEAWCDMDTDGGAWTVM